MSETIYLVKRVNGFTEFVDAAFTKERKAYDDLENGELSGRVVKTQLYQDQ